MSPKASGFSDYSIGHFYRPAAWANFAPAVLAVHWVRVPCLPNPSARTSPARDGFEKLPIGRPNAKGSNAFAKA
ncbi:MAG: hypothetical protein ACK45Y_10125 [Betaproteobacteria bacterium]